MLDLSALGTHEERMDQARLALTLDQASPVHPTLVREEHALRRLRLRDLDRQITELEERMRDAGRPEQHILIDHRLGLR